MTKKSTATTNKRRIFDGFVFIKINATLINSSMIICGPLFALFRAISNLPYVSYGSVTGSQYKTFFDTFLNMSD